MSKPTPSTAPVCPACNGYGSADGLPCGTHERDFGSEAPAACGACGGTGTVPQEVLTRYHELTGMIDRLLAGDLIIPVAGSEDGPAKLPRFAQRAADEALARRLLEGGDEAPPATVRIKDALITISTPEPKSYVFRTVGGAE